MLQAATHRNNQQQLMLEHAIVAPEVVFLTI
jgi:hypothetical protein